MTSLRGTSTAGRPLDDGVVTVLGGLEYGDSSPCSGEAISQALGDAGTAYVALRYTGNLPRGSSQFFQILVADTVEGGWALSNAISGTTQE